MPTAWTAPRTWSAEVLTSALLNVHVRDNENYLKERADIADYAETLDVITAEATTAANTNENTLYTFTLEAGKLGTTGMLVFEAHCRVTDNTGGQTRTLRFKFGATAFATVSWVPAGSGETNGILRAVLKNAAATNSQAGQALVITPGAGGILGASGTAAIDSTGAVVFSVTYQTTTSAGLTLVSATLTYRPAV